LKCNGRFIVQQMASTLLALAASLGHPLRPYRRDKWQVLRQASLGEISPSSHAACDTADTPRIINKKEPDFFGSFLFYRLPHKFINLFSSYFLVAIATRFKDNVFPFS
jgi:hypothetical protein